MWQAGSLVAEAVKTFGALPFASMMFPLQSSVLQTHSLVRLDDRLTRHADWLPLSLVNRALAFPSKRRRLRRGS